MKNREDITSFEIERGSARKGIDELSDLNFG